MKKYVSPNWKGRKAFEEKRKMDYSEDNITLLKHGDIDAIITSPPYGEQQSPRRGGGNIGFVRPSKDGKIGTDPRDKSWFVSDNPDNIANLRHGDIDAIITSPPYEGNTLSGGDPERRKERLLKAGHNPKDFLGGKARNAMLKHYDEVDTIITSPPYSESMTKKRKGYTVIPELAKTREMSQDTRDDNIANLSHGNIDAIITSPPYADGFKHNPQNPEKRIQKLKEVEKKAVENGQKWAVSSEDAIRRHYAQQDLGYGQSKENIGNLPLGKIDVDTIITSPPYAEANRGGGIAQKGYEGKYGKDKTLHLRHDRPLSDNPENISNLRIDVTLFSPPYEGSMEGGSRHTGGIIERTKDPDSDTTVKGGLGVKYSENSNNIGNMKKETYLEAMLKVYSECYKVLKDGGLMIVVVKAFYRNKKVMDLPYQTLLLLQKAGFQFEDVLKLKLDKLSFWRILQFKKNPNVPRVMHEHIIIVRKRNDKQ
jgi:tRNA G10  N-methylase Trm11